jgi:hypothetical protein
VAIATGCNDPPIAPRDALQYFHTLLEVTVLGEMLATTDSEGGDTKRGGVLASIDFIAVNTVREVSRLLRHPGLLGDDRAAT